MKRKVTKRYFWVTIEIFELTKDEFETSNKLEIVRCLSVKKLLNEDILTEFSKENNNTNNYYCSLVFQPKPNTVFDDIIYSYKHIKLIINQKSSNEN